MDLQEGTAGKCLEWECPSNHWRKGTFGKGRISLRRGLCDLLLFWGGRTEELESTTLHLE